MPPETTPTIGETIRANAHALITANTVFGNAAESLEKEAKAAAMGGDLTRVLAALAAARDLRGGMTAVSTLIQLSQMDEDVWRDVAHDVDRERSMLATLSGAGGMGT